MPEHNVESIVVTLKNGAGTIHVDVDQIDMIWWQPSAVTPLAAFYGGEGCGAGSGDRDNLLTALDDIGIAGHGPGCDIIKIPPG